MGGKIGTGRIAEKLRKQIKEFFEKKFNVEVSKIDMWVQPPVFRGPHYDYAPWGAYIYVDGSQHSRWYVYSWDSMTICAKAKRIEITKDSSQFGAGDFCVGPDDSAPSDSVEEGKL